MAHKIYQRSCDAPVELREAGQDAGDVIGTLRGYAVVYDQFTTLWETESREVREVIRKGAFDVDLSGGSNVRALFNHDTGQILGSVRSGSLRLREDSHGLAFEIDLPDTTLGRDVLTLVKRGDLEGMSFGFIVRPSGEVVNQRKEGQRTIVESEIRSAQILEISVVLFPAYQSTSVEASARSRIEDLARQAKGELLAAQQATLDALKGKVR